MNNSLKLLYDEHTIISRAAELARAAKTLVGINNDEYELTISELIRFFRVYADQYHHYKEETILFPELAKKSELLSEGIISEMYANHSYFRELIAEIESDLEHRQYAEASQKIDAYTDALLDHIAAENEELFQAAYSIFSEEELEKIYFRFVDLDRELGESRKKDLSDFLKLLAEEIPVV